MDHLAAKGPSVSIGKVREPDWLVTTIWEMPTHEPHQNQHSCGSIPNQDHGSQQELELMDTPRFAGASPSRYPHNQHPQLRQGPWSVPPPMERSSTRWVCRNASARCRAWHAGGPAWRVSALQKMVLWWFLRGWVAYIKCIIRGEFMLN